MFVCVGLCVLSCVCVVAARNLCVCECVSLCVCAGVHGRRTDTLYMYMWVQREKASSSVIETLSV